MSKKERLIRAVFVLAFFLSSVLLAYIWFGWKMALVIFLVHMSAAGDASLKADILKK